MKTQGWSHIVSLPTDQGTLNVYCYLSDDREQLRAVGDDIKAPGQVVCTWNNREGAWELRNANTTTYPVVRWKEGPPEKVRAPRPHRVVVWTPIEDAKKYTVEPLLYVGGKNTGKLCWPKLKTNATAQGERRVTRGD